MPVETSRLIEFDPRSPFHERLLFIISGARVSCVQNVSKELSWTLQMKG
jgi:hypothetical protein